MRLTLVISSLGSGGAERVMSLLAGAWSDCGREVTILTTHDGGRVPHYGVDPRVKVLSIDPRCGGLRRQIGIVKGIRRHVAGDGSDAVISFLKFTNILVLLATRGLKVPVIVSERLDPSVFGIGPVWSLLRRWTYGWANALVVQTPTAARRFEAMAPKRVRVIPNPVIELAGEPGADDEVDLDGPTFLSVGRLHRQKGFDLLLRAMDVVRSREPGWRLVILGEGPLRAELEALATELGLDDIVRLTGRVRNPWPWLLAAEAFVLSSHVEGFPNALCEAMAAGLPVVSTDCPSGPADIIEDGVDGLLVPVNDADALARGMLRLAGSEEFRGELSMGAKRITDRYRLEAVLDSWDAVLGEVTSGK